MRDKFLLVGAVAGLGVGLVLLVKSLGFVSRRIQMVPTLLGAVVGIGMWMFILIRAMRVWQAGRDEGERRRALAASQLKPLGPAQVRLGPAGSAQSGGWLRDRTRFGPLDLASWQGVEWRVTRTVGQVRLTIARPPAGWRRRITRRPVGFTFPADRGAAGVLRRRLRGWPGARERRTTQAGV